MEEEEHPLDELLSDFAEDSRRLSPGSLRIYLF
jgi:hypothetical protein